MQRGFLGGKASTGRPRSDVSEHVAGVQAKLKEAEKELRFCRQRRLQVEESLRQATIPAVKDAGYPQAVGRVPCLESKAVTALASHAAPPPDPVYRLAESLMLLFKARVLIELREHILPTDIPWNNLQVLLGKPRGAKDSNEAIVAALGQSPFGHRIVRHVRERLSVAPALTQAAIAAVDGRCVGVLDWIQAVLDSADANQKCAAKDKENRPAVDVSSFEGERDRTALAVTSQEQEVVRLRKLLTEAESSDAAARAFAAEHAPIVPSTANDDSKLVAQEHFISSVASDTSTLMVVASTKTLQYRLGEITVPELQETVLHQLATAVTEARSGGKRYLNVKSIAEDREDPGTGVKRGEKVLTWLLEHGLREDQVSVAVEQRSARGSRRVEVQLLHGEAADTAVRQRAGKLLERVLHPEEFYANQDTPVVPAEDVSMEVDEAPGSLTSAFENLSVTGADLGAGLEGMD